MQTDDIILHVGYPKAASTWLQKNIFTEELGFQAPWPTHENEVIEQFVLKSETAFDPEAIRENFLNACLQDAGAPVISHEALVGNPITGHYAGFETARRLAEAFPRARVIIFFRAQEPYAYSAWAEHVKRGGVMSIEAYLDTRGVAPGYRPFCPPEYLQYDALIGYYTDLFGCGRVLALPVEAVPSGEAVGHLATFLSNERIREGKSVRVYQGLQGATVRLLRLYNRFSPYDPTQRTSRKFAMYQVGRAERRLPKFIHQKYRREDKEKIAAILDGRFTESNRRLQELTPAELSKFSYQL